MATVPEATDPAPLPDTDRILTVPNVFSIVRLACFPLFLWLLFARDDRLAAALLLAALGATDWVDGWYARRYHQVSTVGKVLDPTADRILLGGGIAAIMVDGSVPLWVGWLTLVRETLVGLTVVILAMLGARRIDVQWAGKAGTFGLMFAFPFFLGSEADTGADDIFRVLAWICAVPGLLLSYYSAALYVPRARQALRDGRGEENP